MRSPTAGPYAALGLALLLGAPLLAPLVALGQPVAPTEERVPGAFLALLFSDPGQTSEAADLLDRQWQPGFAPMAIETLSLSRSPYGSAATLHLLQAHTGQVIDLDLNAWRRWLWNREVAPHPRYAGFKSTLYGLIDPKFSAYFSPDREATIRLDEIVWGGVRQDGIPPLRDPEMIDAAEVDYLADEDVVFGIEVEGDARAYPKRILAWHEMFVDEVGGIPVAGVYCTLCGTVILYETHHRGTRHALGTSGFLYRSNKLMYDRATSSLWSTMRGEPVVGPLVGQGIALARRSVVTTTWGEWRRRHPRTRVLSLQTGHRRDYAEGAAYREYFATDELMFAVPGDDRRLANKAEVLALRLDEHPDRPTAIAAAFLADRPVHHERVGGVDLVVLTDPSGANRVYRAGSHRFASYDGDAVVVDEAGDRWQLDERALTAPDGRVAERVPAHRAFWFGWVAAFPGTRLVQ